MFKFLNLHPKGLQVNDCVKRSLALLSGQSYQEVSLQLNRLKKETGSKKFNSNTNWKEYVKRRGWKKLSFQAKPGVKRMNGAMFCRDFQKGKYLLNMAHHLTAVVDGVIYDTWDCSEKCVYTAWKVE